MDKPDKSYCRNKRKKSQREADLLEIARLYLEGKTQPQIAAWIAEHRPYTLANQQISYDLATLRQRWVKAQLIDFGEAQAKELAHVDHLEATYWDAWERSKQPEVTEYQEMIQDEQSVGGPKKYAPKYSRKKQNKEVKSTTGDPRYLAGIQWCINKRCQILGFNAPQKVQIDWREEAEKEGVDASDIFERMVEGFVNASQLDGEDGRGGLGGSPETTE